MQQSEPWPQSDAEWVASLCGERGADAQRRSHTALANYLYRVAYNYLLVRQEDIAVLASATNDEVSALAEEFVQDCLLRLTVNDFAVLKQYQGVGRFTSFAAVILRRLIAKELLKKGWTERRPWAAHHDQQESAGDELTPETLNHHLYLESVLNKCLQTLSPREHLVIKRCLIEGYGPQEVAEELGANANTISIVLLRAKNKLRTCLAGHGFVP